MHITNRMEVILPPNLRRFSLLFLQPFLWTVLAYWTLLQNGLLNGGYAE